MSLRPTPAKFSDCGRRNGGRTGAAGVAAAVAAFGFATLLGALFFLAIAGNPTRTRAFLNLPRFPSKLAQEGDRVIDRTKLPDDLWVRMTWAPKNASGIQERPITLVSDRRRWLIGLIPVAVAGLLLIALALLHAPLVLLIIPILVSLVGARYAAGGSAGYYEVRDDGTLGDFLGRKAPVGISEMRRTKA
jgi:hypothetical protein